MTYDELNTRQKHFLAEAYLCKLADEGVFAEVMGVDYDAPGYRDLANALELVPEDVLAREYGDYVFTEDDF